MSHGMREAMISVMLGVQHIAFIVALPTIHARTDVRSEGEEVAFVCLTDLLGVDSNSVVISRRAKSVAPALARGVAKRTRVAEKISAEREQFKRQRVRMSVRTASPRAVVSAVDDRIERIAVRDLSRLDEDLRG